MPHQAAFLRAVNVGGRQMKMARMVELIEGLGFTDVVSYIASGNVSFKSRASTKSVESKIEKAVEKEFGFLAETFARTKAELGKVLDAVPFGAKDVASAHGLIIGFVKEPPSPTVRRQLAALSNASSRFEVIGRELFWLRVVQDSDPKIQKSVEKLLGVAMTGRNVRTVKKMADRMGG